MELDQSILNHLRNVSRIGLDNASQALSTMTVGGTVLAAPQLSFLPLHLVPNIAGGPEAIVVGIYLGIEGDLAGHLMLLFEADSAARVADMLLEQPQGTTQELDELALSALGEAGNVTGSAYLNTLANRTGLKVVPSAPTVIMDMAGAILESIIAELYLFGDDVLVVGTEFNGIKGHFLLLLDHDSMARLAVALEVIE